MISVNIKIVDIEYERTFQQIFPILKGNVHLFQKMDEVTLLKLLKIMKLLPKSTKDALLVMCVEFSPDRICKMLNTLLTKHPYGKFLKIGNVSITREGEALYFRFSHIQVDYKGLVKKKVSGLVGEVVSWFFDEKMALSFFWTEEKKQKLMELAKDTLDKNGFVMELADIQIREE